MYFKDFLDTYPAFAAAFPARVLYDLAGATTGRASLSDAEKTLRHGDMTGAAAFRAGAFSGTLFATAAATGVTSLKSGNLYFPVGAANGLFKFYLYVKAQIGAISFTGS
jgi:hypothetical protein